MKWNPSRKIDLVTFPTESFSAILKVIDGIKFDDPRDSIAFEALINSFNRLSNSRNERLDDLRNSIPPILKLFYIIISFVFWLSYLLQVFTSGLVYFSVLIPVTIFTVLSYAIISDLDEPLGGTLRVEISEYLESAVYIDEAGHDIFSVKSSDYRSQDILNR